MTKPIKLDPERAAFIDGLLKAGRYASADEAVLDALTLLEAREKRLAELRDAWREGVESGDYQPIDGVLDELTERYEAQAGTGA